MLLVNVCSAHSFLWFVIDVLHISSRFTSSMIFWRTVSIDGHFIERGQCNCLMFRAEDIFWLKEAPGKTLVVGAAYIALDSRRRKKIQREIKLTCWRLLRITDRESLWVIWGCFCIFNILQLKMSYQKLLHWSCQHPVTYQINLWSSATTQCCGDFLCEIQNSISVIMDHAKQHVPWRVSVV